MVSHYYAQEMKKRPGGNETFEALNNCIRLKEVRGAYVRRCFQQ